MKKFEHNESWFEQELNESINDTAINYDAVELKLFTRIAQASELGPLSVLKIDEMVSVERLQFVEKGLFSQIAHFKEYEEPINECIIAEETLSDAQWERLETKTIRKVQQISSLPQWEQLLMAPENEPVPGQWESIEDALFEQICGVEELEPWEQCTKNEEMVVPSAIEKAERVLEKRLSEKTDTTVWEQILKRDEILPFQNWENIEETIFAKIEGNAPSMSLSKQPFWSFIENYTFFLKTTGIIAAILVVFIGGSAGLFRYNKTLSDIPTLVYQLQGKAVSSGALSNGGVIDSCSSVPGGAVTFVNVHGVVELQNGSSVKFEKISRKEIYYRVNFKKNSSGGIANGKVSFLVNPHRSDEKFKVNTPDYQISVKGTFFKVEPDLAGKVSTRVLEGSIKISSKLFGDVTLNAGQSLVYDVVTNQYRINNGGLVIQRKEIEQFPGVEDLLETRVITVRSIVPDAEVRIDGKYYGVAPVALRLNFGMHHIKVAKEGFASIDTSIMLYADQGNQDINVALKEIPSLEHVVDTEPVKDIEQAVSKLEIVEQTKQVQSVPVSPDLVAEKLLIPETVILKDETEDIYLEAQKKEIKGNWQDAISLYQNVFDSQSASRLRREDALFSIGKLKADHDPELNNARQVFLTYLALYPGGSFSGECWLRLADIEFKHNPENAIQYYLKYFEMFPRHPRISELQNRVGAIYLQQKRYDEAITIFKQALSNISSNRDRERSNIENNLAKAILGYNSRYTPQDTFRKFIAETR
jgi:tetratricopeptide (TPR) repeat protein